MNAQAKAIYDKMVIKASVLPVEELKRVLSEDAKEPKLPSVVFESMLDALETQVSEADFIAFCEEM